MKTELLQLCPPFTSSEFNELFIQLGINMIILLALSRLIYYKWNRSPEYMFAQIISGLVVFLICALLRWVKLELGFALGLFAIFAIIRFRTINVPVKDMAYMFMVVGISAVNALLPVDKCLQWIVIFNALVILVTLLLEITFFSHVLLSRNIAFNNTDLLRPEKHDELISALKELTGLQIIRFEVGKVDYNKKQAQIKIYFPSHSGEKQVQSENNSSNDDD